MYCANYNFASLYIPVCDGCITENTSFIPFSVKLRRKSAILSVQAYPSCFLPDFIYRAKSILKIGLLALFFCIFLSDNISKENL